jgi:hypothetical protein
MATQIEVRPDYWQEPKITANAHLLAGYIGAGLRDTPYALVTLDNPFEVENIETGNRFRVSVEQVSGTE